MLTYLCISCLNLYLNEAHNSNNTCILYPESNIVRISLKKDNKVVLFYDFSYKNIEFELLPNYR